MSSVSQGRRPVPIITRCDVYLPVQFSCPPRSPSTHGRCASLAHHHSQSFTIPLSWWYPPSYFVILFFRLSLHQVFVESQFFIISSEFQPVLSHEQDTLRYCCWLKSLPQYSSKHPFLYQFLYSHLRFIYLPETGSFNRYCTTHVKY